MVLAVVLVLVMARREVLVDSERLRPGVVVVTMLVVAVGIVVFVLGAGMVGMSVVLMVGSLLRA